MQVALSTPIHHLLDYLFLLLEQVLFPKLPVAVVKESEDATDNEACTHPHRDTGGAYVP